MQTYARFQSGPRRQSSMFKRMMHGICTRKYERVIEDFTDCCRINKSGVSPECATACEART